MLNDPAGGGRGPLIQDLHVTDPEDFRSPALGGIAYRMVLRGRGRFEARRRRLAADGFIVSRGRTNMPLTHRTGTGDFAFFTLVQEDGPPSVMQGESFAAGALAWCRPGAEVHAQSPADATWWNACFSFARLERAWGALFGAPLVPPAGAVRIVPIPATRQADLLAGLSAALCATGEWVGATLPDGLLRLLLEPFAPGPGATPRAEDPRRSRRLRVVEGLVAIADGMEEPLSLVEVCAALGVPLRTLNACSNAVLGMSAGLYLRRRRLHRVRADLSGGAAASVTEAATRHGFWELGRFAGDYRVLFGETPSGTLRRARP